MAAGLNYTEPKAKDDTKEGSPSGKAANTNIIHKRRLGFRYPSFFLILKEDKFDEIFNNPRQGSNTYSHFIEAMERQGGSDIIDNPTLLIEIQAHDDDGIDEDNQLQAVSAKGPGKKEAHQVLDFEARLTS